MKFQIREGAAASLGTAAVVARILYGITIDLPWLYNSGWISVLLGGVLALPVALAAAQLRAASAGKSPLSALNARRPVLARLLAGVLMLTAAFDATMAVDAIADSAGYAALDSVAKIYLLLPQLALCAWGLTLNGDAIGDSARICNRILLCIFVLFMLREIPDLCPESVSYTHLDVYKRQPLESSHRSASSSCVSPRCRRRRLIFFPISTKNRFLPAWAGLKLLNCETLNIKPPYTALVNTFPHSRCVKCLCNRIMRLKVQ